MCCVCPVTWRYSWLVQPYGIPDKAVGRSSGSGSGPSRTYSSGASSRSSGSSMVGLASGGGKDTDLADGKCKTCRTSVNGGARYCLGASAHLACFDLQPVLTAQIMYQPVPIKTAPVVIVAKKFWIRQATK